MMGDTGGMLMWGMSFAWLLAAFLPSNPAIEL
jgi:hypothetical protein